MASFRSYYFSAYQSSVAYEVLEAADYRQQTEMVKRNSPWQSAEFRREFRGYHIMALIGLFPDLRARDFEERVAFGFGV